MKRWAFAIAIAGIFLLLVIFHSGKSVQVNGAEDLGGLMDNQKIVIKGVVEEERFNERESVLYINGVRVICKGCKENYLDKKVMIEGVVEKYEDVLEVDALFVKKIG